MDDILCMLEERLNVCESSGGPEVDEIILLIGPPGLSRFGPESQRTRSRGATVTVENTS